MRCEASDDCLQYDRSTSFKDRIEKLTIIRDQATLRNAIQQHN